MRGLKCIWVADVGREQESHPAWDAWIEIDEFDFAAMTPGRIPHGMRGLKWAI